jgi:hypothetical protein
MFSGFKELCTKSDKRTFCTHVKEPFSGTSIYAWHSLLCESPVTEEIVDQVRPLSGFL